MTGYELRRVIDEVLGHFWHESFGQIYPTLADLSAAGLVESEPGNRPRSRVHRLTDAGRARLAELLAEPPAPQPPRNGTLLRVFFGRALPSDDLAALLDAEEESARSRQAAYAGIRAALSGEDQYAEHHPYWLATIRAGELATVAYLTWIQETRAALLPPATLSSP
jgi:DNA-binding PadR family transcriptional regulator